MLRHAISTAKEHDHCGMMGIAMLIAHQVEPLQTFEQVARAFGSQRPAHFGGDGAPCIAGGHVKYTRPCIMRVLNDGKIAFKPNALWCERVCEAESTIEDCACRNQVREALRSHPLRRFVRSSVCACRIGCCRWT